MPRIPGFTILKVLKGAYGLTEAPRLWYLRARELFLEIGFQELSLARAVFVYKKNSTIIAYLNLHVDDGLLAGKRGAHDFEAVVKAINSKFNIKFWKILTSENPFEYLGMTWTLKDGVVCIHMDKFIKEIIKYPLA